MCFGTLYAHGSFVVDCVLVLYKFFWTVVVVLCPALLNGLSLAYNVQRESACESVSFIFRNVVIDSYRNACCPSAKLCASHKKLWYSTCSCEHLVT